MSFSESDVSDSDSSDDDSDVVEAEDTERERSYIVQEKNLLDLFKFCPKCGNEVVTHELRTTGFGLTVLYTCSVGHHDSWTSMEFIDGHRPTGNTLIPAALVMEGRGYEDLKPVRDHFGLQICSKKSYFSATKEVIYPCINLEYKDHINEVRREVSKADDRSIIIATDMACDSPGRNANIGITIATDAGRAIFDEEGIPIGSTPGSNLIIGYDVKHRSQTNYNSARMEMQAFTEVMSDVLNDDLLKGKCYGAATDGCTSIPNLLKQLQPSNADLRPRIGSHFKCTFPPTKQSNQLAHVLDPWHLIKGMRKKLTAEGRKKQNSIINDWLRSIINHVWKSIAASDGNPEKAREMVLSILWHVIDLHDWYDGVYLDGCLHDKPLPEGSQKKWFDPDSDAYRALKEILTRPGFLRNLDKTVMLVQTSENESWNSKIRKYLPKRHAFRKLRTHAMCQLAIMSWNSQSSNSKRKQARRSDGTPRFRYIYSKSTGRFAERPIYSYGYNPHNENIMKKVVNVLQRSLTVEKLTDDWPRLSAPIEFPGKNFLHEQHQKRLHVCTHE